MSYGERKREMHTEFYNTSIIGREWDGRWNVLTQDRNLFSVFFLLLPFFTLFSILSSRPPFILCENCVSFSSCVYFFLCVPFLPHFPFTFFRLKGSASHSLWTKLQTKQGTSDSLWTEGELASDVSHSTQTTLSKHEQLSRAETTSEQGALLSIVSPRHLSSDVSRYQPPRILEFPHNDTELRFQNSRGMYNFFSLPNQDILC
jgi:hypothetical protein